MNYNVIKASGESVPFSEAKLRNSLERSGATAGTIDHVAAAVKDGLYEGITTREIYSKAFGLLRKQSRATAGRYNMKRAIMELGPSGFPFEKYVAEILKQKEYKTAINQVLYGRCVKHEVDVICKKEKVKAMIECKFHNSQGIFCDVKVPLYIHSRFEDICAMKENTEPGLVNEGWLVTNTKFSDDAIQYGNCAGLKLIGWNYPRKENLQRWIEASGLYPVTCLTTLTRMEKRKVLEGGLVLCRDLPGRSGLLSDAGVTESRVSGILDECRALILPVEAYQPRP